MKLYIAGAAQALCQDVAAALTAAGHKIVSTWLTRTFMPTNNYPEYCRADIAVMDVKEVQLADALVLLSSITPVPGGKFVEAGVAIGLSKPVYVLGHRENMLMWHPLVKQFDSVDQLVTELQLKDQ